MKWYVPPIILMPWCLIFSKKPMPLPLRSAAGIARGWNAISAFPTVRAFFAIKR